MSYVSQAATLVSFPVAASGVGAVVALRRRPGPALVSAIQHFAAGVVTAALVGEIMPELQHQGRLGWTVFGFVSGAALVLGLGAYGRHTEEEAAAAEQTDGATKAKGIRARVTTRAAIALPIGMLAAMAVDLLLDGVLIGLGVRLGANQGLILTIALTLEILFLALSLSAELIDSGVSTVRAAATCIALGLVTAVGAVGAAAFLGGLSSTAMAAVLAFGAAALLYLVVEELLVEAHEEKETVWLGAMFFLGFILIYVLAALGG